MKHIAYSQKGIALVELVVAVSIVTLTVFGMTLAVHKSVALSDHALYTTQASFLLEEGINALYVARDTGWSTISSLTVGTEYYLEFTSGTWNIATTPQAIGKFTRKFTIADVDRNSTTDDIVDSGTDDPGTKKVHLTVSWKEGTEDFDESVDFYIMDNFGV